MADHKITDFVDQSAIDALVRLRSEMVEVKETYVKVSTELLKGMKLPVNGYDELQRLTKQVADLQNQAAEASRRHSAALDEQQRIAANTTNTISRVLMEQERVNKANREAYTETAKVKEIIAATSATYKENLQSLLRVTKAISDNKAAQAELAKQQKNMGTDAYAQAQLKLVAQEREYKQEKTRLVQLLKNEERQMASVEGSYNDLSQKLEMLKKAYKELSEEERASAKGNEMLTAIQNLDAHLKDIAADMGEFQRNVGNYAIAASQGSITVEAFTTSLAAHAVTVADCVEQNKALEQARLNLNSADANYAATLEVIDARILENKKRILDVDSVMNTQARTVQEAEEQNKHLAEAIKLVDYTTDEGKRQIAAYNKKIEENKAAIEAATPALQDHAKASEGLVDKMLSLVGVNNRFGSSMQQLAQNAGSGSVFEGLNTKVKALGKTVMGLVSNPWVLAFLGIAGVAAAAKWWYDYNKGMVEATRLTKDFTGASGQELDGLIAKIQAVSDTWGKDYKEVLNATDKMAAHLGITHAEALETIKDGFIANADAQGNFLANIEKFSPALVDAGLKASELVAIIAQTRSGVFSEEGLKAIQVASDRLKRMPKATSEAIEGIGLSVDALQKGLADGTLTMMDAIRQVSEKIGELPANSEQVGEVVYNVFGRKAAAGGLALIKTLATINTNLDDEKAKSEKLGEVQQEQYESQCRLNAALNSVFKMSGTSFQQMTTQAKTFVNKGLVKIIEGCVDVANWFVRMYNNSLYVRAGVQQIWLAFKVLGRVGSIVFGGIVDSLKLVGKMIEGIVTFDLDKIKEATTAYMQAQTNRMADALKNTVDDFKAAVEEVKNGQLKEVTIDTTVKVTETTESADAGGGGKGSGKTKAEKEREKQAKKEAKEREKQVKEEVKRINELEAAKLAAMEEGHEKEMETIRVTYSKKIREITGNSEKEIAARKELTAAMNKELAECQQTYDRKRESIDLANKLESVKKGSEEELKLKKKQLKEEQEEEERAAEKTGANVYDIRAKYKRKLDDLDEEFAANKLQKEQDRFASESALLNVGYEKQQNKLKKKYLEELEMAGSNEKKRADVKERYEQQSARLSELYAIQTAEAAVQQLEKCLEMEGLSDEERAQLADKLAEAKMRAESAVTDHLIAENERRNLSDAKANEKRKASANEWLQAISGMLNGVNDLASAIYDAKIERIDSEVEAQQAASEAEQQSITDLVEKKVITEEEGEARKRAAAAVTARKEEELEKKKQQLKQKQAIWDKANSIAQTGINTALAIMASAKMGFPSAIPFVAMAAALGAIQMATILATPIPKYAKGTESHPGGLAIVGDGGKQEVVSFGGQMYLTPDKPTVIDMPRGAEVLPDASRLAVDLATLRPLTPDKPSVVVNNDYSDLKREIVALGMLIKRQTKAQQRSAYRNEYEQFKLMRGL